ncbi:Protein OBERON [Macleaya cordata]|uniref:OBERON-like protein n=1 Tax=Macleaya cordata TaxID=56857 RepID=A0A200Q0D6_MACCD|nr:Protein OBERON [Macleaya cordata]
MGFQDKEISGKNLLSSLEKGRYKGKEVVSDSLNVEERLVERDFLQLNGSSERSAKRESNDGEDLEREKREKKPKLETLNLSLSLPDVSLSLTSSNPLPKTDQAPVIPRPSRSTHSLAPSNNNTRTGSSDDFTAASLSHSFSHQFSHNPSCSLTRNSTENYDYSMGSHRRENDQIWYCGEGTNGSVHSRFKPVGDGVSLSSHGGFGYPSMQSNPNAPINKDSSNSFYRPTGSENNSFFPSELPARPRKDTQSGDSRGRASEQKRVFENSNGGRARKLSRPERILREIVSESIPVMAQIFQELPDDTIESTKEYLKNLIRMPEKREEFAGLQNRLERRSDLTFELVSKSQEAQLDILVAVKTGLANYLIGENRLPTSELVEIFLLSRCRNVNCKSLLPIEDCDCKICSSKKGFCSACMCPVCFNFDSASNTCSWVGCDACSHWCHAVCGIQMNLIKPSPRLGGPTGTTEMQFHCLGCGHASDMYGFVKDVFTHCAKDWGLETLIKELDCVKKIFRGSEDSKGKELQNKAEEMLSKLENKLISPSDACNLILQFFKYGGGLEFSGSGVSSSKDLATAVQISQRGDLVSLPPSNSLTPKPVSYNVSSSIVRRDLPSHRDDARQNDLKSLMSDRTIEKELQSSILSKDGFDSLENVVRIKEAEARMFQTRADDARREAEGYRRMARVRSEKLEEEYTNKLSKLCLQETEERRRKKLEELKALENSHCDYYNMKIRMQAEIASLLERMEATKQQWV